MMMLRSLRGQAPANLMEVVLSFRVSNIVAHQRLRSVNCQLFDVPRCRLNTLGRPSDSLELSAGLHQTE